MGIAAASADELLTELRGFVDNTSAHLKELFVLLDGPLRIVWAHSRAAVAIKSMGIRPATRQSTGLTTRYGWDCTHRLNILAVSQSKAGDRVRDFLYRNDPPEAPITEPGRGCLRKNVSNDPIRPWQVSEEGNLGDTQLSSQSSTPHLREISLTATQSEFGRMPRLLDGSETISRKRGYIRREKYLTMEEQRPKMNRKSKIPRIEDLERGPLYRR